MNARRSTKKPQGTVTRVNRTRCIASVHVEGCGYVVVDWISGTPPRRQDVLQGDLHRCGGALIQNTTSKTTFAGYVHLVACSAESAEAYIA